MLELPGQPALSDFRLEKLRDALQKIEPRVKSVSARFSYFVAENPDVKLSKEQRQRLESLLLSGDKAGSLSKRAHTVYVLVPQTSLLVQERHVDWISIRPIAVDRSEITLTSLVPAPGGQIPATEHEHWQKNFDITRTTLDEDFVMGEGIHAGLSSGANEALQFGRNEGLLDAFNRWVDEEVAGA